MVVEYEIRTDKFIGKKRLCFLSDLHGQNPPGTLDKIAELSPDVVVLGGDLFDRTFDSTPAFDLACELISRYECVFSPGNHDAADRNRALIRELEARGLCVLDGGGGAFISDMSFLGLTNPADYICAEGNRRQGTFSVLIDHVPDNAQNYPHGLFDLILSGHEHGGLIKIGRINGLIGHSGLFPAHAGGEYRYCGTVQVVSRGMCRGRFPRIGIPPELVVINIVGKKA